MPAPLCSVCKTPSGAETLDRAGHFSCRFGGLRLAHRIPERLDVYRMQPFRTLNDIELHRLSSLERSIAVHLDGRIVGKKVFVAPVGYNEAITFGIIEPLDLTNFHTAFLCCPIYQWIVNARYKHALQGLPVTLFNIGSR